jgi:hypothetical protein
MGMLRQLLVGSALLIATVIIHSLATAFFLSRVRGLRSKHWTTHHLAAGTGLVAGLVFLFFLATLVEVALWAITYTAVDAMTAFEPALYFSMVTFTTLGYGDIVLTDAWRLLASFQAATGIIIFGWTTAVLVALMQRLIRLREGASGGTH